MYACVPYGLIPIAVRFPPARLFVPFFSEISVGTVALCPNITCVSRTVVVASAIHVPPSGRPRPTLSADRVPCPTGILSVPFENVSVITRINQFGQANSDFLISFKQPAGTGQSKNASILLVMFKIDAIKIGIYFKSLVFSIGLTRI